MSVLDTKEGREDVLEILLEAEQCDAYGVVMDPDIRGTKAPIVHAIIDPAKLAEFMASEGRRLGWPTLDEMPDECARIACMSIVPFGDAAVSIAFWYEGAVADPTWIQNVDLPKARRIFAKWLQLPDGAREQAERVLRGET